MPNDRAAGAAIALSGSSRTGLPSVAALPRTTSPWRVSGPLALGMVLFVTLLGVGSPLLLGDPDTHWHIAIGDWMLGNGRAPTADAHSHTFLGQPWIAKEWLSQLLLTLAYNGGGWPAVAALAAASIGLTFALLLRLLLRDVRLLPALLFTLAAVAVAAPHFLARPHVLAFPAMLLWVAGLVQAVEQRRAPAPLLLLVMLAWANLHGGFTLGLLLCGAFALEAVLATRDAAERKALFLAWAKFGAAAILAACITPYGPESILVTGRIFGLGEALGMISEWRSPDFQGQPIQELILLLALYAALSRGLRLPAMRLVIVLGLLHLFLKHARNAELLVMLAPLVVAPVLARQWPSLRPPDRDTCSGGTPGERMAALGGPAGPYGTLACLSVAAVFAAGIIRAGTMAPPADTTPAAAFDFVRQARLEGPVFNAYDFGGYLVRVGVPTFIDGRGELFGGEFIKRYAEAVNLRGGEPLEQLLDRYGIEWTFLAKDQPANRLLERLPGWRRAYGDDVATIFVRRRPIRAPPFQPAGRAAAS